MDEYHKERIELNRGLGHSIKKELFKWQSKFPIYFYMELFRLNGWNFTTNEIKIRSKIVGTWVNVLVYDELPENVQKDLQIGIPSMEIHSQPVTEKLITRDIGNPHLKTQINHIITLFQLSDSMESVWEKFKKTTNNQNGESLKSPFDFNEEGYSIVPIEKEELSDFNKKLIKGLNWNPKDHKK